MKNNMSTDDNGSVTTIIEFQTNFEKLVSTNLKALATTTTIAPDKIKDQPTHQGWMPWGTNDNFPQENWDKIKLSGLVTSVLEIQAKLHFGGGLFYFKEEINNKNKRIRQEFIDKDIDKFMRVNRINLQYADKLIRDYVTWYLSPVEFTVDQVNKKVLKVKVHDAMNVRWFDKNEDGLIEKAALSAHFPNLGDHEKKDVWVVDPLNVEESIQRHKKSTNFIYPVMRSTPGRMYYPEPKWFSIISSKWLDVSLQVPLHQLALLQNSSTIKYKITIHKDFWKSRYDDWDEKENLQLTRKEDTIKELKDALTGSDKAGKMIITGKIWDEDASQFVDGMDITSIADLINDKAYLMTGAASNSEILFDMAMDPATIGHSIPGGKDLSGSGSDKLRAMQGKQALLPADRIFTLDFMQFVSDYNGWDAKWAFRDITMTTLDKDPDGMSESPPANE